MLVGVVFVATISVFWFQAFATEKNNIRYLITINDGEKSLKVRAGADTVGNTLKKAKIKLNPGDNVEPGLDEQVDDDYFFINIYRARPIILIDKMTKKYLNLASHDAKSIAKMANINLYDGDEMKIAKNRQFLEAGAATVYEIIRHGGETVTEYVEIPAPVEEIDDYTLPIGKREVISAGLIGSKQLVFKVHFVDKKEKSRELVSEKIVKKPTAKTVRVGRKPATTSPLENEKITWHFLIKNGFSEEQTAGIMGNLMQEHRFSTSDTRGGLGIAQWTGGRRRNLLTKENPFSIETQLNYLMEELNGKEWRAKKAILESKTIDDATRAFQNKFERCGICLEQVRIGYAYGFYERYKDEK